MENIDCQNHPFPLVYNLYISRSFRHLLFSFHRSTWDLILEGIRLQYQYFLEYKFFTDTMQISVIEAQLRLVICNFKKVLLLQINSYR